MSSGENYGPGCYYILRKSMAQWQLFRQLATITGKLPQELRHSYALPQGHVLLGRYQSPARYYFLKCGASDGAEHDRLEAR